METKELAQQAHLRLQPWHLELFCSKLVIGMRENQNGSLSINILSDEEDEGGNAIPKSKQESEVGFNLHFKAVGFSKGCFFKNIFV